MDENIITWNVTNWVTVLVMAVAGFMVVGTIQSYIAKRKAM